MKGTDDLERLVAAAVSNRVFERAPSELFDRVLDATRNRRPRPPWLARATGHHLTSPVLRPVTLRRRKETTVNGTLRLVAALAAVAIGTVAGITLLAPRSEQSVGAPPSSPASSTSATPTPAAVSTPMILSGRDRLLEPGTYVAASPVEVTFTVGAGWKGSVPGPNLTYLERNNEPGEIGFSNFDKVSLDPCDNTKGFLDPAPGPSVDALAGALENMPNIEATSPVDVTVGGYRGKYLTLIAPSSFDGCTLATADTYLIGQLPLGAVLTMAPSQRTEMWILDVRGERLVIDVPEFPGTSVEQRAEVQAILDSIHLDPGN